MAPLLEQIDLPIAQFTADGAYDGEPTYDAVTRHSADAIETAMGRYKSITGRRLRARSFAAQQTEVGDRLLCPQSFAGLRTAEIRSLQYGLRSDNQGEIQRQSG